MQVDAAQGWYSALLCLDAMIGDRNYQLSQIVDYINYMFGCDAHIYAYP
jgi:hypothetical protein